MPQIAIDYTENLEDSFDVGRLVRAVHGAARGTGAFPTGAIHVMARPSSRSMVGDGDAANAFIHVGVLIAPGRSDEVKRAIAAAVFAAAEAEVRHVFDERPMGLQLALSEFEAAFTMRRNTMTGSRP